MSLLDTILASTRERIRLERSAIPDSALHVSRVANDFPAALRRDGISVIAEIKRRSPSAGPIAPDANAVRIAGSYLAAGAAAISLVTEPLHFGGSVSMLRDVRAAHSDACLLMKDFVIDPYQLRRAVHDGADAVLLIVKALERSQLHNLHQLASELGLHTLVEVHDESDMETAAAVGARMIGINNRDLGTMRVSLDTSRHLRALAPGHAITVCESGISRPEELAEMARLGFDACLVGTSLMRAQQPGAALRALLNGVAACA